jgi:hypothetical protein
MSRAELEAAEAVPILHHAPVFSFARDSVLSAA